MTPDKYQQAVIDEYRRTNRNIFISATAGSGKTTCLLELAKRTPPLKSSIFLAFNKSIAEELGRKLPPTVKAMTLHGCALAALRKAFALKFTIKDNKYFSAASEILESHKVHFKRIPGLAVRMCRLHDLMRYNLVSGGVDEVCALAERYGEDCDEKVAGYACELYSSAERTTNMFFAGGAQGTVPMDFTDMLVWAVKYVPKAEFKQYSVVMCDECLPYNIPVICENGLHLPIGKIVEEHLPIKVLTYNHITGAQEYKSVIGYSRTFNTKKCLKIKAKQRKHHGQTSFITCTFNHKIWVKAKGYVYAEEVKIGDIIQYETSAIKTEKYRVTPKGKDSLVEVMTNKNASSEYRKRIPRRGNVLVRGGNGRINDLQRFFIQHLTDKDWESEGVILTGVDAVKKYHCPNHYKVDVLNRRLNVAIEIDGQSHFAKKRRDQDMRKTAFLEENGYKVIRITNQNLLNRFDEIVDAINNQNFDFCFDGKDCPIYLEVTEITEMQLSEKYVYDITVADNHNFYANGVLVHNCQDISPLQYELIKRLKTPKGRLVAVGDPKQSIYSFQGSNLDSLHAIQNSPNTVTLPLSITYRCAKAIVKEAQRVFPEGIEAAPTAVEGTVTRGRLNEAVEGDFILCRNNAPLIDAWLKLVKMGRRCVILGKDFGDALMELLDGAECVDDLEKPLVDLLERLHRKGIERPERTEAYANLDEKVGILLNLFDFFGSLEAVRERIFDIFVENADEKHVILSTIHKSKGLEADRVFFLEPELIPSRFATTELSMYAERCLMFVAITRAKKELIYI